MSMDLHCKKCLTGRTGDALGAKCGTAGCDGTIEESPAFHALVDVLPEPMTCGRRDDSLHNGKAVGADRWQKFKSNGNRTCSYCGSLHPDDLFAMVKLSADAIAFTSYGAVPEIEPSDKGYKIYVKQPGVRNAMEGGIKFYTQHMPRDESGTMLVTPEQQDEYGRAVRASRARHARYIAEMTHARMGRVNV